MKRTLEATGYVLLMFFMLLAVIFGLGINLLPPVFYLLLIGGGSIALTAWLSASFGKWLRKR